MICMILKVNLGDGEMGFMFCDTHVSLTHCQAHFPVQFASNIKFIWCSHWLFRFSILHSNKTVKKIKPKYKSVLSPQL